MKYSSISTKAFTLLELLMVLAVVALVTLVSIPAIGKFQGKAKKAACIAKMRSLHGAFSSAITDTGEWPQVPVDDEGNAPSWNQVEYFEFWMTTMEPYGTAPHTWACPADDSTMKALRTGKDFIGSYIPTQFGPGSKTPFRWSQPWIVERAGFHGKGHHVVMPDGSVSESANPLGP